MDWLMLVQQICDLTMLSLLWENNDFLFKPMTDALILN